MKKQYRFTVEELKDDGKWETVCRTCDYDSILSFVNLTGLGRLLKLTRGQMRSIFGK